MRHGLTAMAHMEVFNPDFSDNGDKMTSTQPLSTNSLANTAMLASVTITTWSARKYDPKVTQEVIDQHNAKSDAGRWNKMLIAKEALQKITKAAGAARTAFYQLTLPWGQDGSRILTATGYNKLMEVIREKRQAFDDACEEFFPQYHDYVEQAKIDLNGTFRQEDYPSESEIRAKFRFAFHVSPLPVSNDFRVKMSDIERKAIEQQITDMLTSSVQDAVKDVWQRMQTVVSHMANSLRDYKVHVGGVQKRNPKTGKTRNVSVENNFHSSVVNNIRELVDIIPALNLTGDPDISRFAEDIKGKLTRYDAETLKDNDGTRELVAKNAEDILKQMSQFV